MFWAPNKHESLKTWTGMGWRKYSSWHKSDSKKKNFLDDDQAWGQTCLKIHTVSLYMAFTEFWYLNSDVPMLISPESVVIAKASMHVRTTPLV